MTAAVVFRTDLASAVVSDPDWMPHCFEQSGMLTMCYVPVKARATLPFLRPDFFPPETQYASVPSSAVRSALAGGTTVPLHFVFHTAFCGSTLLANALDALSGAVAFKEPAIFPQLAHLQTTNRPVDRGKLDLTLRLFARRIGDATANVVKPSCFGNPVIRPVLQARADTRAVLLHGDLRSFLLSVAKRGMAGHNWGRQAFNAALQHYSLPVPYPVSDLLSFTDLQVAGMAWLMRTRHFSQAVREFGQSRCMAIEAVEMVREPFETLNNVARFLEIDADSKDVAAVVRSEVFRRHSKDGRTYGSSEMRQEFAAARGSFGREIDAVASWVEQIASECTSSPQSASSSSSQ